MIKIATFIYYLCVVIQSAILSSIGYGCTTWQWWVILFCLIITRMCGRDETR